MFTSIGLTISGLFFSLMIAVVYFTKKKYNNVENNIYRFLLMLTIFLLILELVCVYTMSIRDRVPVINEILCRLYILGDVVWFNGIVAYLRVISDKEKYHSVEAILQDLFTLSLGLVSGILFFISCMLEIKYTSGSENQLYVIGGKSVYILYFVFAVVGVYMFKVLFKNLNKNTLIKRIPIFAFLIFYGIMGILQIIYADINDLTFIFALSVVSMYFTIENQDMMLASELEVAKKEAEEADMAKAEFLSKMSHEIRTPMNSILGFSESILNTQKLDEETVKKDVKNIYNAGKGLLETINNILTFSNIESGNEQIELIEYNIMDIVSELESYTNSKIDNSRVSFEIKLDDKMPAIYYGDKLKLYRIILNIMNNSINYTEEGLITLSISCDKLENNDSVLLKITISDTGYGIKEEELKRLFEGLTTDGNSNSEAKTLGTGLGLSVVKKLSDLVGANISLESEYGIGTTFNVEIEQKVIGTKTIKSARKEFISNEKMYFNCSKYSVLIVDDNKLNLKVIERLLSQYKLKCDIAENGSECIEKVKSGKKYNLILLDHLMPELDGIETLRILKRLEVKKLPPVVAMSANVVTEIKETYLNEGFDDYLSKPVEIKQLNTLLRKYFLKKNTKKGE